jgi:hypothetical protein
MRLWIIYLLWKLISNIHDVTILSQHKWKLYFSVQSRTRSFQQTNITTPAIVKIIHRPAFYLKHKVDDVRTSQETRYVSATEPNRLMLSIWLWRWYINITITIVLSFN